MKRVTTYPVDYVRGLKNSGNRKKAMAFMDYWDDFEVGEFGSERKYANYWNIGNATAHRWLKEFDYEIDRFLNYWKLKNQQHYNKILYDEYRENGEQDRSAKKQVEQMEQSEWSRWSSHEIPENRDLVTSDEAKLKSQVNEVFNNNIYIKKRTADTEDKLNDGSLNGEASTGEIKTTTKEYSKPVNRDIKLNKTEDYIKDRDFNELVFIYRNNGGNSNYSKETYLSYINSLKEINIKLLKMSCMKYLHDNAVDKKVWLKRFLEEKIYQKYLKPLYKLTTADNKEFIGTYDLDTESFYMDDNKAIKIDKNKYYELIANDRLIIEGYVA